MTSITWANLRYVQELTTILHPQNRTQGSWVGLNEPYWALLDLTKPHWASLTFIWLSFTAFLHLRTD